MLNDELTHGQQQSKSLQGHLIQRELAPVTPATNEQRRDFVQEAIRFLNQAAAFYHAQTRTAQARLDRTIDGITSTYTNNESIINTYLNRDAILTKRLKAAYRRTLRSLLQNGARLLNIRLLDLYIRYADKIPSWAWPDFSQTQGRVQINGTVGLDGNNAPDDVRAVQQRLHAINLLSQAHFQAELVAANAANVNENAIQNTIQAIARLHRELAGSKLWIIRPDSREEEILNNPPRFRTQAMEFSNSVGQAQNNAPADVRLLLVRLLNLTYLTQANFDAEVVDPANPANPAQVPDNQIQQTIAALISFQVSRGLNGNGQVGPGSETHCMLIRPSLPTVRYNRDRSG